jgi:predicted HicB family RNase H-like nuclease
MSETTKKRPGRPATGQTKAKPGLTIDKRLIAKAKKVAFRQNMSLSAYVERAIANYLQPEAQ